MSYGSITIGGDIGDKVRELERVNYSIELKMNGVHLSKDGRDKIFEMLTYKDVSEVLISGLQAIPMLFIAADSISLSKVFDRMKHGSCLSRSDLTPEEIEIYFNKGKNTLSEPKFSFSLESHLSYYPEKKECRDFSDLTHKLYFDQAEEMRHHLCKVEKHSCDEEVAVKITNDSVPINVDYNGTGKDGELMIKLGNFDAELQRVISILRR